MSKPVCFVMMPISDVEKYQEGHFKRVYEYLIKPACERAGFNPMRADEVKQTNYIVIDILKKILDSEMVLCDLSARNPNVLYELGIRQAFNKPVALIKDSTTERIFDIQGLRQTEYDVALRVDTVERDVKAITDTVRETAEIHGKDINSLIQLLGIQPATTIKPITLSAENELVLGAIRDVTDRLSRIEKVLSPAPTTSLLGPGLLGLGEDPIKDRIVMGLIRRAMTPKMAPEPAVKDIIPKDEPGYGNP